MYGIEGRGGGGCMGQAIFTSIFFIYLNREKLNQIKGRENTICSIECSFIEHFTLTLSNAKPRTHTLSSLTPSFTHSHFTALYMSKSHQYKIILIIELITIIYFSRIQQTGQDKGRQIPHLTTSHTAQSHAYILQKITRSMSVKYSTLMKCSCTVLRSEPAWVFYLHHLFI